MASFFVQKIEGKFQKNDELGYVQIKIIFELSMYLQKSHSVLKIQSFIKFKLTYHTTTQNVKISITCLSTHRITLA